MSFEFSKLVRSSTVKLFISQVRCYARGTRLTNNVIRRSNANEEPSQIRKKFEQEDIAKSHVIDIPRINNELPHQLLENAASFKDDYKGRQDSKQLEDVWNSAPYPRNSNWKQSQAKFSVRPSVDPRQTSIVLFPGQGTQYVGMGKDLLQYPNVKDMYELASSILGYDLLKLCLKGSKNDIDKTQYCQPAVLVTSLACLEKLRATNESAVNNCVATAGFSVGELAALTFAGALSFEDAIKLVKVRAEAMQLASEITPSGMMTVFYGPDSKLNSACSNAKEYCIKLGLENVDCKIANYLFPHCKVIAGNMEALDFVEKHAADFKLKRLKRLPVSGAFHTELMEPAIPVLRKALEKIKVSDPLIPVHSNVDGKRYKGSSQIVKQLPKQIKASVCWEQTMHILYERNSGQAFPLTYECGPGNSLKSILKMVNAKAALSCSSISC